MPVRLGEPCITPGPSTVSGHTTVKQHGEVRVRYFEARTLSGTTATAGAGCIWTRAKARHGWRLRGCGVRGWALSTRHLHCRLQERAVAACIGTWGPALRACNAKRRCLPCPRTTGIC